MPTPRNQQISLSDTPYYHCISRCVRRSFLCGTEHSTNKDYTHRKQWIVERYQKGECHSEAERIKAQKIIQSLRERLMDISWFMRCLNEHIARKANAEDHCTGRFWDWFLRPVKPAYITSL